MLCRSLLRKRQIGATLRERGSPAPQKNGSHQGADGICLPNAPFFVRISLPTPFLFPAKYGTIAR